MDPEKNAASSGRQVSSETRKAGVAEIAIGAGSVCNFLRTESAANAANRFDPAAMKAVPTASRKRTSPATAPKTAPNVLRALESAQRGTEASISSEQNLYEKRQRRANRDGRDEQQDEARQ